MHTFGWNPSLETGIAVIDRQHRRIVEYICLLREAHASGYQQEYINSMIAELVQYTQSHFIFEEAMQQEASYPFLREHKQEHDAFAGRLKDSQDKFARGENDFRELCVLLETWLFNHVSREDADYVEDVREILQQDRYIEQTRGSGSSLFR